MVATSDSVLSRGMKRRATRATTSRLSTSVTRYPCRKLVSSLDLTEPILCQRRVTLDGIHRLRSFAASPCPSPCRNVRTRATPTEQYDASET